MSEKKNKEIQIPVYDLKSQAQYLKDISDTWHVGLDVLTSCIFADFILSVEEGLVFKNMTHHDIAVSYFEHADRNRKLFDKLKKEVEKNESRK